MPYDDTPLTSHEPQPIAWPINLPAQMRVAEEAGVDVTLMGGGFGYVVLIIFCTGGSWRTEVSWS